MSLINDMLRDLEARRAPTALPVDHALDGLTAVSPWPQSAARALPWVAIVAVCTVAAAFSLELMSGERRTSHVAVSHVPAQSAALPVLPMPTAPRVAEPTPAVAEPPASHPQAAVEDMVAAPTARPTPAPAAGQHRASDPVTEALRAEARAIEAGVAPAIEPPMVATRAPEIPTVPSTPRADPAAPAVERPGSFRREAAHKPVPAAGDVALTRALNQLRGGDRARGIAALADYLRENPLQVDARLTYARALIRDARHGEAETALRDGLEVAPRSTALAQLLAHLLFEQSRVAAALEVLRRAAPRVAADPDYHAFMAAVCQQMNRHADAAAIYRAVLTVRPSNGSAALGMAISLAALGRVQEARGAFARAATDSALSGAVREYAASEAVRLGRLR
ncbi:MAG: tetratricopeptide repeat protein [Gammaproteobacteria bacterium]